VITRIRRPYWIAAHLVLLALAATFAANAVSSIVRGRLAHGGVAVGKTSDDGAKHAKNRPLGDYLAIAKRDLFAAVPASEPVTVAGTTLRSAPASLQLLGTGSRGDKAFAVVEDAKTKIQKILIVGDKVDDAEVVDIGWRHMVLRRAGQEELLVVPPNLGGDGSATASTTAVSNAAASAADGDQQIRKIGDDRYLVAQAEVEHSMSNLSELFTQMRAVPNMQDGKTNGFRLFAIRSGSLFQKIGLQNNDVVQRINGIDLNDPGKAMSLFQDLQGETKLSVDVVRGGETRTLSYEIR
jgi:general secretion pathway protein C